MRIKTLDHVNVRTRDGRVFSAMADRESLIDDADADMCDAIRSQVTVGLIEILDDEPTEADQAPSLPTNEQLRDELHERHAQAVAAKKAAPAKAQPARASGAAE